MNVMVCGFLGGRARRTGSDNARVERDGRRATRRVRLSGGAMFWELSHDNGELSAFRAGMGLSAP